MSNKKQKKNEQPLIVKEVKFGGDIKVKWEEFNDNIESYEPCSRDIKEQAAESFFDSARDLVQQAAQELGYPNSHEGWGAYKPKKIKLDGLKVVVEFIHFTDKATSPIETNLPETNCVAAEVVEDFIAEARNFINGAKGSRQGDLFNNDMHEADIEIQDAVAVSDDDEDPEVDEGALPEKTKKGTEEGLAVAG